MNAERIEILDKAGWCFGEEFFIQAALFELTGYADWDIKFIGSGDRDNQSDGEFDKWYSAKRAVLYQYKGGVLVNKKYKAYENFEVHGNGYSYTSIYKAALEALRAMRPTEA